jgi:hypothetical protein
MKGNGTATWPWIAIVLVLGGCDRLDSMQQASRMAEWADTTPRDTTTTDVVAKRDRSGREATLLSAFFGLDDALPSRSDMAICPGAAGQDGMPVLFSHEIDVETMQAGDFRVVAASGAIGDITCVTPAPADDPGEARTILVVGQYGSAADPPATVEIVGNLLSRDGQLNFLGSRATVTALEAGPEMVWAEVVPEPEWDLGKPATPLAFGGGTGCPADTRQVVRVAWAGGVTRPGGEEIGDLERAAYRVTLLSDDGEAQEVVPFAIGDLGDGDNNHELCLDRTGAPLYVEFPAGLVTDPREDLNPITRVRVHDPGNGLRASGISPAHGESV